eukprot:jgi/Psemu1/310570/fgenesh1_kg.654_\
MYSGTGSAGNGAGRKALLNPLCSVVSRSIGERNSGGRHTHQSAIDRSIDRSIEKAPCFESNFYKGKDRKTESNASCASEGRHSANCYRSRKQRKQLGSKRKSTKA